MNRLQYAEQLLSESLRRAVSDYDHREAISDIRLRRGRKLSIVCENRERELDAAVTARDLACLLERATNASPYASKDSLAEGYVTAPGGLRIGFCGEVVSATGLMKHLSSAAIRLPGEQRDWGRKWVRPFVSTLILSPPGCGKTTLLRDMVRLLSDGGERVGLCDDRGEVAAAFEGENAFDVGAHTDVIAGGERAASALMLLRNMNPTVIAMDELTGERECAACLTVSRCGVMLLATAHGCDAEDLQRRRLYRSLLEQGVFQRVLVINAKHEVRELWL